MSTIIKCNNPSCTQTTNLKYCARCNLIKYCSKECQISNWLAHKRTCSILKADDLKTESIMKKYNLDSSNVNYVLGQITKKLFVDVIDAIPFEEREQKAFIYDKHTGYGYTITPTDKQWITNIPKSLLLCFSEGDEHKCIRQRIVCVVMNEIDGGIATVICDCT
jgi:hypothetical protein